MLLLLNLSYVFFFSSRRRHTRYWRDWSSDVCSSDLAIGWSSQEHYRLEGRPISGWWVGAARVGGDSASRHTARPRRPTRSEERRVGKECRSRWSPYH